RHVFAAFHQPLHPSPGTVVNVPAPRRSQGALDLWRELRLSTGSHGCRRKGKLEESGDPVIGTSSDRKTKNFWPRIYANAHGSRQGNQVANVIVVLITRSPDV